MMRDQKDRVIYVGKAKNLKNRVLSYFQASLGHTAKTKKLVKTIEDFEIILVETEVEALLLERTLIKTHDPKYNILLRDDKEYPYIRIGVSDPWPRVSRVRKRLEDGAVYLGPFGNVSLASSMLQLVYKIFPIVRCSDHEFQNAKRPCNYYHMGLCLGPCKLPVERSTYMATIEDVSDFLRGRTSDVAAKVKTRMLTAASHEEFELAGRYRDQLFALENLAEKQHVVFDGIKDADAISAVRSQGYAAFHVLMVRDRHVTGRDSFVVSDQGDSESSELMESFLLQYYEFRRLPTEIFIEEDMGDLPVVSAALKVGNKFKPPKDLKVSDTKFEISKPERGAPRKLLDIARKNAEWALEEQSRKGESKGHSLEMVAMETGLDLALETLECIDISNMGGTAIVASCVRFQNGKPHKEMYRLYNIEDEALNPDDFECIRRVVRRRLERALRDQDGPQTLMIDGGKGQLSAAAEVFAEFPTLNINLISLAKSRPEESSAHAPRYSHERIFMLGQKTPVDLKVGSNSYRLFTQIRDEAHRFAISHHRKRRSKVRHSSVLDSISGIGPVIKRRLFEEFGSLEQMRDSTLERLLKVKGLSSEKALGLKASLGEILKESLNEDAPQPEYKDKK
jgi:excinuclease ABC subunit C